LQCFEIFGGANALPLVARLYHSITPAYHYIAYFTREIHWI